MISAATSGPGPSAAAISSAPADASGRSSALRAAAGAAARGLAELAIETVAPQLTKAAKAKTSKSATTRRSTASRTSSAGYAKKTSTTKSSSSSSSSSKKTAGDPLAFLDDPKLSIDEKLMRLLAQLNARYEQEMQQHMDVLAGKSSSASKSGSSGGTSGTTTKKKKGGIFGALASVVTKILPSAVPLVDVLKDKTFQAALKKLGGPVLAAGASALGFPALAPVLLKIGPDLASGALDLAKALDAELKSSSKAASGSSASSSSGADGKSQLSSSEQQLELMKLQQLQEKQKEMFGMVSAIFRMQHETRSSIIGNLR